MKNQNKEVAKTLAKLCYGSNTSKDYMHTRKFIEELVLPKFVESYSEQEIESYILEYMERNNIEIK